MSRRALSVLCSMLLAGSHPAAAGSGGFNLSEPAPGVFVHAGRQVAVDAPGHDDIANIGFVTGDRCVAVVDTGGSVSTGRALRAAIRAHTRLPVCYVINTHVHFDHVLGNAAFRRDRPSFVGSAALPAAILRSRAFFVSHYGNELDPPPPPAPEQIIAPDRLVRGELTLDLGNRRLQLRAWPAAHTDCDLTVYDVRTGTLWTGDLLFRERLPALDGSLKGWLAAIDELARWPVHLAIPGHGSSAGNLASALAPERRYLQALLEGVRAELKQGKPMQDALGHVANAERSSWLLWDDVHPRNVVRAYEELEWE